MSNDPSDDLDKATMYLSPYELWNFGPGRVYAFPAIRKHKDYITALAEFRRPAQMGIGRNEIGGDNKAWLPTLWNGSKLNFLPFVINKPFDRVETPEELQARLSAALKQFSQVLEPFVEIDKPRFRVAFPVPKRAMHSAQEGNPQKPSWAADSGLRERIGQDKRITIMAIIDDGLPFAHRHFRDATGKRTRVEFCWLQSVAIDEQQRSVLFGREYTRSQIEDHIAQYGDDEDTLYREAGATLDTEEFGSPIERHATHGGHVMDLATGYATESGEAPAEEIRIIAVQLPNTIAWDTSGFGKDMYMLSAFHYIFDRADMIAEGYGCCKPRLVINFSYGFSAGRHDGNTELEAAIDQLIAKRREYRGPTALILPAGNSFLDRLHATVHAVDFDGDAAKLHWRIQPNNRTPSYLELWFTEDFDPSGYTIELWDPLGLRRRSLPVTADQTATDGDPRRVLSLLNDDGQQVGQISADYHRRQRWRVLLIMAPTEPEAADLPGIEAGMWTVVIRRGDGAAPLQQPIQCWIQRAADPGSLRTGSRQSYFDDVTNNLRSAEGDFEETDTEDALVRRFGSLNGLATGSRSLIVAGYRLGNGLGSPLKDAQPALYSSAGPLDGSYRQTVSCSAMSDRSRVLTGTIAAGVRSGARSYVQGTSTAAPVVARQLAEIFVTADDQSVEEAADGNYLALLSGWGVSPDIHIQQARLGAVLIPPHRQPSVADSTDDARI